MAFGKVYDVRVTQTVPGEMGRVNGTFKFDGRTKAGQSGAFTHIPGADPKDDIYLSFVVISVRKGQKIRKEMKACAQKDNITKQLIAELKDIEPAEQEFGVDTERELAAAHANSNAFIAKALQNDPELRAYVNTAIDKAQGRVPVEAALGKHHDDLLEIPDFLKRT